MTREAIKSFANERYWQGEHAAYEQVLRLLDDPEISEQGLRRFVQRHLATARTQVELHAAD